MNKLLLEAIQNDDFEKVKEHLKYGARINAIERFDGEKETPLSLACSLGKKEMASFLIEQGASVDTKTESGYWSLMAAASKGHKEIVELLLEKGATLNTLTTEGDFIMGLCIHKGYPQIAKLLAEASKKAFGTEKIGTHQSGKMVFQSASMSNNQNVK